MNTLEIINDWKKENKITNKNAVLLIEAYRRWHAFNRGEKLVSNAWLGLGYRTEYTSPLFVTVDNQVPSRGCMAWYKLTEPGRVLLSKLIVRLPWKAEFNHQLFIDAW